MPDTGWSEVWRYGPNERIHGYMAFTLFLRAQTGRITVDSLMLRQEAALAARYRVAPRAGYMFSSKKERYKGLEHGLHID